MSPQEMWPQEQEEYDFHPMSMADEMNWQHAQGMTCSFDCAQCDPPDDEEVLL